MTKKEIFDTMQKCLDEMRQAETDQEGWVCKHCGKSTFETDYDYLANADEHLGCALKKEKENDLGRSWFTFQEGSTMWIRML